MVKASFQITVFPASFFVAFDSQIELFSGIQYGLFVRLCLILACYRNTGDKLRESFALVTLCKCGNWSRLCIRLAISNYVRTEKGVKINFISL